MKIIHINQRHKLGFGIVPVPEIIEATVRSQFRIAQELKKYPGYPIVLEGLYEDALDASSLLFSQVAKIIFPNGFPKNLDDLNSLQKDFLYDQGAAFILFYLGEIPAIYKSIHKEASTIIDKSISNGNYSQIFAPREIEVMKCAKEAAIKQFESLNNSTVIIIFGADHNLKPYCDKEGFEHELIDTIQQENVSNKPSKFGTFFKKRDAVPGYIVNRIKRAEIYLNKRNYQKALEDFIYVNKKYPANSKAADGIRICAEHLESEKSFSKNPLKKQTSFFVPDQTSTTQTSIVQIELQNVR